MRRVTAILGLLAVTLALVVAVRLLFRAHDRSRATGQSVTGELMAYEASHRDLLIRTATGDRHFIVRDGTLVHKGAQTVALATLASAARCRAKVWYQDADSGQIAREIRIACEPGYPVR